MKNYMTEFASLCPIPNKSQENYHPLSSNYILVGVNTK